MPNGTRPTRSTVVPRPGIKCMQTVHFEARPGRKLDQREQGELESALNDEFLEPKMGELAIVFRSRVVQSPILTSEISVFTTTSELEEDHIDKMRRIIQQETEMVPVDYTVECRIERKSLGVDET